MPWGTIVICVVVAALFFFAIRRVAKKGLCGGECGGQCEGCHGGCETKEASLNVNESK